MTMQPSRLREIRAANGMTQEAFAQELGMSRKSVNLMENGEMPIEQRTALAIRRLDPLRPAFTVGGKAHGHAFWIGSTEEEIKVPYPRLLIPFVAADSPAPVMPQLSYRYSGVTLPESGERVFVPADEEGWDEDRAHREALIAVKAWRDAAKRSAG